MQIRKYNFEAMGRGGAITLSREALVSCCDDHLNVNVGDWVVAEDRSFSGLDEQLPEWPLRVTLLDCGRLKFSGFMTGWRLNRFRHARPDEIPTVVESEIPTVVEPEDKAFHVGSELSSRSFPTSSIPEEIMSEPKKKSIVYLVLLAIFMFLVGDRFKEAAYVTGFVVKQSGRLLFWLGVPALIAATHCGLIDWVAVWNWIVDLCPVTLEWK